MNWQACLPSIVVVVLTGGVCVLAWSGVNTTIADAIFMVGIGFCLSHVLCFSYSLGRRHERDAISNQVMVNQTKVRKPRKIAVEKMAVEKEDVEVMSENAPSQEWNPAKDF